VHSTQRSLPQPGAMKWAKVRFRQSKIGMTVAHDRLLKSVKVLTSISLILMITLSYLDEDLISASLAVQTDASLVLWLTLGHGGHCEMCCHLI